MSDDKKPAVMDRRALFKTLAGRAPKKEETPVPDVPAEPDPLFLSGMDAYRAGDMEKAVADLRPYVRANQRHVEARRRLGHALYALGQHIQAKVEFETALKKTPDDPFCRLFLGLALLRMGKTEKARTAWENLALPENPGLEKALREDSGDPARMAAAIETALAADAAFLA
jgi:tetratricopeptide (TPR) repeat protein